MEGGLLSCCLDEFGPWKFGILAFPVKGKDADDMNGRCSADPSVGWVASLSGFDGFMSPNRADQHARRISSANLRVRSSAASRASTTTCLNPKRASREGFGVDGRAPGIFICENDWKLGVGDVTRWSPSDSTVVAIDDVEDGRYALRMVAHRALGVEEGGGEIICSRGGTYTGVGLPRLADDADAESEP